MRNVFFLIIILVFMSVSNLAQNVLYPKLDSIQLVKIDTFKAHGIPLFFLSAEVWYDAIGTPEVRIIAKNISNKDIDAYSIQVYCYNNYNEPVNHYSNQTNVFNGISQGVLIAGKTTFLHDEWTLYGYDNTTKVKIYLKKVHFTNDSIWFPKDKKITMIEGKSVY